MASPLTFEELLQERQWRSWFSASRDVEAQLACFVRFCEEAYWIKLPEGRSLLKLRPSQLDIVRLWLGERYVINLKARQLGISTVGMAFLFWSTFFYPDRQVYVLSRREQDAVELASRVRFAFEALPEWVRARGPQRINASVQSFVWSNGSIIESHQSKNSPIRGRTAWAVFCDELGFWEDADQAWAAIEPAAELGGRLFVVSTANGMGNNFERLWHAARARHNSFKCFFIPWFADGVHNAEEMEKKRAEMPEWLAAQEYPTTEEEAFIRSGRTVFNIGRLTQMELTDPIFEGRLQWEDDAPHRSELRDMEGGPLSIWHMPDPLGVYCMGVDVAEGHADGDYSSVHVIDVSQNTIAATWHGHLDPDIFGDCIAALGHFYNECLIGVEANNHGHTTLRSLQRTGYGRIYRRRREQVRNPTVTELLGWATTKGTKGRLIDGLVTFARENNICCSDTVGEMMRFVREDNGYGMHGSPFDDRVLSMAIAVRMMEYVFVPEFRASVSLEGTFEWWMDYAMKANTLPPKRGIINRSRKQIVGPIRGRRDRVAIS